MKIVAGTYALMAAVVFWAVLLGGIVYSNVIVMPVFLGDLPGSAVVVTGRHAINEAPLWMAIHPLVVLSTATALVINWRNEVRRKLIAISLGIYILVLVVTALFFVPELMAFGGAQSNTPAAEWAPRASRWLLLSAIRGVVMFVSFVPILFALVVRGDEPAS